MPQDTNNWNAAVSAWFRERIDLRPLAALLRHKTVPAHRLSWTYLLGGAAMFLFALQIAGGVLLMLYYQPSDTTAYESVRKIATEVPCGWLVRSVHAWGADLFIGVVALHFVVKLFSGAYRRPRELTWLTGMVLLGIALAFGFSGYLLPWNELSYSATLVGTQIAGTVPVVGDAIVHLLRGGEQVTGATITRFFAAHVVLLPLTTAWFMLVHVALVQSQGLSLPLGRQSDESRANRPFVSEFLLIDGCLWLGLLATILTLATFWPAGIGVKADPLKAAPAGIKPEWYFLFMFQTLKHVHEFVGVAWFAVVGLFLFLVPFLDRQAARGERNRPFTVAFVVLLAYAAVFEFLACLTPNAAKSAEEVAAVVPSVTERFVALAFVWAAIGFLLFYLYRLLQENTRLRKLYAAGPPAASLPTAPGGTP